MHVLVGPLVPHGVTVKAIAPALTKGGATVTVVRTRSGSSRSIPVGRLGSPKEVARLSCSLSGTVLLRPRPSRQTAGCTCASTMGMFVLSAQEQGMLHLYAPVYDNCEAVLFSVACGLFVDHAGLHPQYLRPGGNGILRGWHDLLTAAEHIYDVYTLRYLLDGGVGLLAQDRLRKVRVDGEDFVPRVLHNLSDGVARTVRVV